MKRLIVIVLLGAFFLEASAQLREPSEEILIKVFEDGRVSREIYTQEYLNRNSVYIAVNNLIVKWLVNYDSIYREMPPQNGNTTKITQTKTGSVFLFLSPDVLNVISKYTIHKVVVFDRINISKATALILFHTTNLDDKKWNKGSSNKFKKFEAHLFYSNGSWTVGDIRISDCKFKEVPR